MESVNELLGGTAIEQDALDRSLYEACCAPLVDAIAPLLEAGANPNKLYSLGSSERIPSRSPLANLVEYGAAEGEAQNDAVASCLDKGADPNLRDEEAHGATPVMLAANYHLVAIAQMLIDAGADPTLVSGKEGRVEDALYEVFTREDDHQCMDALVAMLLGAGAKPDEVCGRWQRSPLMVASGAGALDACRRLVGAGANVDRQDASGNTAYALASKRGHGEVCEFLIACGATVSSDDRLRATLIAAHNDQDWGKLRGLGNEAIQAFPKESWVFQAISLAHHNAGEFDSAAACARRGIETAFADILVTRLVVSLHHGGRNAEAVEVWGECKGQLELGKTDRHLLANVSAIYNELGRRREGLDELASFIDAALEAGSEGDGGLLDFNLACLYTLEGALVRALRHAASAVAVGKEIEAFDTDADLNNLRTHPAYRLVVHQENAGSAWSLGTQWPVREVLIDGDECIERYYPESPCGDEPEVTTTEHSSRTAAALAYVARTQVLRSEGWQPCDAPAIAYWAPVFIAALEGWGTAQTAGTLKGLAAMVVEWDFGESDGERNMWIAGYGDAPAGTFVMRKESPFSFVLQEHDCGHESTVVWRE